MRRRTLFARLASTAMIATAMLGTKMSEAEAAPMDPQNTIYMDLKDGRVVIQLLPDIAPKAVERVKALCKEGFYDGTLFHRVIEGFMAQGGDPSGTGTGGSKLGSLPAEFTRTQALPARYRRVRRARSDPNSADSQFFIMFAPAPNLDGQYTIWGQVVSGMEFVDKIKRGSGSSGMVQGPDKIIHMRLAADVKG